MVQLGASYKAGRIMLCGVRCSKVWGVCEVVISAHWASESCECQVLINQPHDLLELSFVQGLNLATPKPALKATADKIRSPTTLVR